MTPNLPSLNKPYAKVFSTVWQWCVFVIMLNMEQKAFVWIRYATPNSMLKKLLEFWSVFCGFKKCPMLYTCYYWMNQFRNWPRMATGVVRPPNCGQCPFITIISVRKIKACNLYRSWSRIIPAIDQYYQHQVEAILTGRVRFHACMMTSQCQTGANKAHPRQTSDDFQGSAFHKFEIVTSIIS